MNIIELQKQIYSFLRTKADRVYFEDAPDNAVYPYIVYDLPNSNDNFSNREDFTLEVDFWDKATSTKTIDALVESVDGDGDVFISTGLHRKQIYIDNILSAKFYRESRLNIRDEDKRIKRRQLRYRIQTY